MELNYTNIKLQFKYFYVTLFHKINGNEHDILNIFGS